MATRKRTIRRTGPRQEKPLSDFINRTFDIPSDAFAKERAADLRNPWKSVCEALGTEFRDAKELHGQSGMAHPIAGLGIDEVRKRLIVVSADHNPRVSALMRIDVHGAMPDYNVMVARPVSFDLAHTIRNTFFNSGGGISLAKITAISNFFAQHQLSIETKDPRITSTMEKALDDLTRSGVPMHSHILSAIDQLAQINWLEDFKPGAKLTPLEAGMNIIHRISQLDGLYRDRNAGICPLPTFEFTNEDWEIFLGNKSKDDTKKRIVELGIYQYFFPPKDTMTLGLLDHGITNPNTIGSAIHQASADGHIISDSEIAKNANNVHDILDALSERGLIVEGETSWEFTEAGKTIRNTLKYRPQEGLISRISKIIAFRVDISLSKIFGKE